MSLSLNHSNGFNEELLDSSGQNIKINDKFFLSDILRVEYDSEARTEVVKEYLNSVLPSEIIVLTDEPALELDEYVLIYPNNSGLICTKSIKVAINRFKPNFFSFYHDKPKSYCFISLAEALSKYDGSQDLQDLFENATNLLTLIKLKSDIIRFLYTLSQINTRVLMKKCNEAKLMFTGSSKGNSLENSRLLNPQFEKGRVSDFSESCFEYSVSSDSEDKADFITTDNQVISNTGITEGNKECKESSFQSEEASCDRSSTPKRKMRQFDEPTGSQKFIFKLIETQMDSTNFGVDTEKYLKTTPTIGKRVKNTPRCYRCETCVIG